MLRNKIIYALVMITMSGMAYASDLADDKISFLRNLATIQDGNLAQKMVRHRAKGDKAFIADLYKVAEQENLARPQIFIANSYYAAGWAKDAEKDFSTLEEVNALESYNMVSRSMDTLQGLLGEIHPEQDWREKDRTARHIFRQASNEGSVFATLVEVFKYKWSELDFWQAARLRPYLDDQDTVIPELLFWYGEAMMSASPIGTELYYEGLSYKNKSGMLRVNFFDSSTERRFCNTFKEYCRHYYRDVDAMSTYYDHEGQFFIGGVVLSPSKAEWKAFERKFLLDVKPSPIEVFDCFITITQDDIKQLHGLYKQFEIGCVSCSHGEVYELSIYRNNRSEQISRMGSVSVDSSVRLNGRYKLVSTLEAYPDELRPLVKFMEDVMTRSASSHAFHSFFESLNCYPTEHGLEKGK